MKGPPGEAADPVGIRGLTFHLPCEEMERLSVKESVSGRGVGSGWDLGLVPGVRGKALRTHVSGDSNTAVVQKGYGVAVPPVAADRSFTLAVWSRWSDAEKALQMISVTATQSVYPQAKEAFRIERSLKGTVLATGAHLDGVSKNGALRDWVHHAVVRDAGGAVTLYENGQPLDLDPKVAKALGGAAFNGLNLGHGRGECRACLDDVCLFDRALSADEVLSLAGRAAIPKSKEQP